MKQLTAKHPMSNVTIVERFIEGIRYMKVTPKTILPMILEKLKIMFADKPVTFEVSESGWIKIEKTGQDKQMEDIVKKAGKIDKEIDEEYILNKEADMLRKQGFNVEIKDSK